MQSFDELYSPTRTRLIGLLRRSERTVPELAEELGVSGNAVRGHLAALETDGVIAERGVRREGVGKPALVYGLTPSAQERLSLAYAPVLNLVVEVLESRMGEDVVKEVLEEVGRRIGRGASDSVKNPDDRIEAARSTLEDLGGAIDIRRTDGCVCLEGAGCPLGTVVRDHPEACVLAAALVSEIVGRPVREECDRAGEVPRCRFEVEAGGDDEGCGS